MLPMFQGADKVFRNILVPLAGLREMLLLRDAIRVKKDMFKHLPPERAQEVKKAIAKFYAEDEDTADPVALKSQLLTGWSSMKFTLPFSSSSSGDGANGQATESTSLV